MSVEPEQPATTGSEPAETPAAAEATAPASAPAPAPPPGERVERVGGGDRGGERGGERGGGPARRGAGGGRREGGFGRGRYPRRKVCGFCVDKVKYIDYKDTNRLRRHLTDRAKIESRRRTGTCAKHQRALSTAIKRARQVALLPFTAQHIRLSGMSVRG